MRLRADRFRGVPDRFRAARGGADAEGALNSGAERREGAPLRMLPSHESYWTCSGGVIVAGSPTVETEIDVSSQPEFDMLLPLAGQTLV